MSQQTIIVIITSIFSHCLMGYLFYLYLKRCMMNLNSMRASVKTSNDVLMITAKQLKDTENSLNIAYSIIKHLGYTIHHLGLDIVYKREEGIVNSYDEIKRKTNGQVISLVGTYYRMYPQKNNKTGLEVAELFSKAIDNKQEIDLVNNSI